MHELDMSEWVNKTRRESDETTLAPAVALAATLDLEDEFEPGATLPPLWHWLYFLPKTRRSELGVDGHAKRGGFLPPVTLPQRAWAGSRLVWEQDLHIGERIHRISTIEALDTRTEHGTEIVVVTVRHEVLKSDLTRALIEWQDICYRRAPATLKPAAAPRDELWQRRWAPDPVLLFRFSALTFNAHRIHYDHPYSTGTEGYAGLVVHRPLLAILMLQLAKAYLPGRRVREFEFRGLATVAGDTVFEVCGHPETDGTGATVFVRGGNGVLCAQGRIGFFDEPQF